jgi:hypothetical protein
MGLVLGLTSLAMAGIPDADNSTVASAGGRIMICPLGDGITLAEVGGTIDVNVRDGNNAPIANYPGQDVWADDSGTNDINLCQGGSGADANTDVNGDTTISGTLGGGGWTLSGLSVYISGIVVTTLGVPDVLAIDVNSPDISGNRSVALEDVGTFAADLLAYHFRSDLVPNDPNPPAIDLSDVGRFAAHIGHACP